MSIPDDCNSSSGFDEGDLIRRIVAGDFVDPSTGQHVVLPIRAIRIATSLDGGEADLLAEAGITGRLALIADAHTWAALGRRVARNLRHSFRLDVIVLRHPKADEASERHLTERVGSADALVAVGAGTINDLVKAVAARSGRDYTVFATALSMNGYASNAVSLFTDEGMKTTRPACSPRGIFIDLNVAADAPLRLTCAGLGDSICRTTVQVDGLLSHQIFGTPYSETPFLLQSGDEGEMLAAARGYPGRDLAAYAALARILVLTGIGAAITGSTHCGSMSEHLVSHTIDMFAGDDHPGSLHGEQVGISTLAMAHLQSEVFGREAVPEIRATRFDSEAIRRRFGASGDACLAEFRHKVINALDAARLRDRLQELWPGLVASLRAKMRPLGDLVAALEAAGAPSTAADIALPVDTWREAVRYARVIRNRYTVLDLADDSGQLVPFVEGLR